MRKFMLSIWNDGLSHEWFESVKQANRYVDWEISNMTGIPVGCLKEIRPYNTCGLIEIHRDETHGYITCDYGCIEWEIIDIEKEKLL